MHDDFHQIFRYIKRCGYLGGGPVHLPFGKARSSSLGIPGALVLDLSRPGHSEDGFSSAIPI